MTSMPTSSGSSSRRERSRTNEAPASRRSMNDTAAPETRNSSDSRQGELRRIHGSSAVLANGLFTCQSHVT